MPMNVKLIREWIEANNPQGMSKLSAESEVSIGTIVNVLKHGHVPNLDTVKRLAKVMEVSLDEMALFEEERNTTPAA